MNDQMNLNEKEIVSAGQPQYYQAVILIGCSFYLLWGYIFSHQFGHYDPMSVRFLVCLPPIVSAILSFKFEKILKHIRQILYACLAIAVAHYHFVMLKNSLDMQYILGALIFLFTIVNVILEPKYKIIFASYFAALSSITCYAAVRLHNVEASENYIIHLYGVGTVMVFAVINYLNHKKTSSAFLVEINENTNLRRWSSVGQMAGGIAHEVNTPLATMMLTLENLNDKLAINNIENAKKDVSNLIRIGTKIGNIVQSLRLLTITGGKFERDKVSLFEVMISAKNEYAGIAKEKNISLDYLYNIESDGKVWGSSSSLKHVVSNLIKNAIDAVEGLDEKWIKFLLIETKTHYKILVQNSGPLIDKANAERIFEPFFTTKDVGSAMGIGLSISKTLVLAHSGTIKLDMKNPHVMFEVSLPKIKAEKKKTKMAA